MSVVRERYGQNDYGPKQPRTLRIMPRMRERLRELQLITPPWEHNPAHGSTPYPFTTPPSLARPMAGQPSPAHGTRARQSRISECNHEEIYLKLFSSSFLLPVSPKISIILHPILIDTPTPVPKNPSRRREKAPHILRPKFRHQGLKRRDTADVPKNPTDTLTKPPIYTILPLMPDSPDYLDGSRSRLLSSARDIEAMAGADAPALSTLVPIAHQTLAELMVSDISPSTRLAAAESVLDRVGTPKRKDSSNAPQLILNFSPSAAVDALAALRTVFSPVPAASAGSPDDSSRLVPGSFKVLP